MTKIAVIHSSYLFMPQEAVPGNDGYCDENARAYIQSNINKTLGFIDRAGLERADICVTHEDFTNAGAYGWQIAKRPDLFPSLVEKFTDIIRERMSALAKKYNMIIAANNYERIDGKLYNTSTLYGRDGRIIGRYRKVHLPSTERWDVAAGDDYPVFATDIGNIGFITCYDIYFPEACRSLALNGADIVIHQTQGWGWSNKTPDNDTGILGEAYMRVRASENCIYLVVSKVLWPGAADGGRSVVVSNYGRILADSGPGEEKILYAEIAPDFDMDNKYAYAALYSGIPALRPMFMLSRRPDTYGGLTQVKPQVLGRYPNMRFRDEPGEPKAIMEFHESMPEKEKKKYHW